MPLPLPPKMLVNSDEQTIKLVSDLLTSVIPGHTGATHPYTFYEEVDRWLGPWGPEGYPIGYGKFYAIAFNENALLQADPEARAWVHETTRQLQFALRDYILMRMRQQTLRAITEPELRQAAFDSHAKAYTDGGLARVVLIAPVLLPVIATIPGKEFNPLSPSFKPTVMQVLETIGLVGTRLPGYVLPALMPAHSGLFRRAALADEANFRRALQLNRSLGELHRMIVNGEVDNLPVLRQIAGRISQTDFGNHEDAAAARMVQNAAERRQREVSQYYITITEQAPEVRGKLEALLRGL